MTKHAEVIEAEEVEATGTDIVEHRSTAVTPMDMIDRALASNANPDTLEKLLALQERWEANQARKAFDEAMASAKADFQPIITNRRVAFESKKGGAGTNYKFEDLAQIERQIGPILSKHGLSYRYAVEAEPDQPVRVTCVVSHRDGHSERTSLSAGRDQSGNKNSIQAIGSTVTYLQRYTLKAALGLAVAHDDDAARAEETAEEARTITEEQRDQLQQLLDDTRSDVAAFCQIGKINSLMEMPAGEFADAVRLLEQKKARMQKEQA